MDKPIGSSKRKQYTPRRIDDDIKKKKDHSPEYDILERHSTPVDIKTKQTIVNHLMAINKIDSTKKNELSPVKLKYEIVDVLGEIKYKCGLCNKLYTARSGVYNHWQSWHK